MHDDSAQLILVVDDDERLRQRLARAFEARGLAVRTAGDYDSALEIAKEALPELAVVDLRMPGPSGLELIRALKELDPETKIVVLTGYGSIATTIDAMRLGAVYYLQKPADADDVLAAFARGEAPVTETLDQGVDPPSLERVKWEHVSRVLADCGGNVSEAARKLKLHRRSLQRMLQKFPPRE
ncbi:MAG TPA: response regulator [Polyangiales bacterium]|nr:response regulator [Polyangiales bacterium]